MSGVAFIKSPCEFSFGEDVDLFLARFGAFAEATKCEAKSRFDLFKSFLDDRSFRRVQAIAFEDTHKTDSAVDMSKEAVKNLIVQALAKEPHVPERISLKFKVQSKDEGIEDFGDAVRLLGQKVHGQSGAETNQSVIEAFCAGLRNPELASKLLRKKFENLTAAINYAVSRKEVTNIKNVISRQRATSWDGTPEALHNLGKEADASTASGTWPRHREGSPARQATWSNVDHHQGPRFSDSRTCFRCNRVGHIERFCNQALPASPRPRQSGQITCYQCGLPGHIRRDCRASTPTRGAGHGQIICYRCNVPGHTSRDCTMPARQSEQNFRGGPGNRGAPRHAWPAR